MRVASRKHVRATPGLTLSQKRRGRRVCGVGSRDCVGCVVSCVGCVVSCGRAIPGGDPDSRPPSSGGPAPWPSLLPPPAEPRIFFAVVLFRAAVVCVALTVVCVVCVVCVVSTVGCVVSDHVMAFCRRGGWRCGGSVTVRGGELSTHNRSPLDGGVWGWDSLVLGRDRDR